MPKYESVIGLEIHVQLKTRSKLFSGEANADALEPNINISPISMGHPGTLPVLNQQAVDMAVLAGLALHCDIAAVSRFDRKQYFYPDLPKGYQISQHHLPLCSDGYLAITEDAEATDIRIERIHLEEDAAKNVHTNTATWSILIEPARR